MGRFYADVRDMRAHRRGRCASLQLRNAYGSIYLNSEFNNKGFKVSDFAKHLHDQSAHVRRHG